MINTNNFETLHLESGDYVTTISAKYRHRKFYKTPQKAITAAIPGTIISVLVKEGQNVKRGDALCVMDSMKMNITICATESGKVSKVYIKSGEVVAKGALMVEFGCFD